MKQIIITFLLAIGTALSVVGQQKPNVLFLAVDDWNDMVAAFGDAQAVTPNLDKLAEKGVRFTNAHTAAAYCTPSRVALMTGLGPWNTGCYDDQPHHYNLPERKTIDELFNENGYKVHGAGKVYHHMPGFVNLDGFDEYYVWREANKQEGWPYDAWNDDNLARPTTIPAGELGMAVYDQFDVLPLDNALESEMADTKTADWAVDFLKKNHTEPFFLAVGMYAPHKPNYCPQKYFDMHPLEDIQIPEQIPTGNDLDDLPQLVYDYYKGRRKNHYDDAGTLDNTTDDGGVLNVDNGWKKAIQGYLACCSYADAQLGKVLEELYASPYADNTIIVLWSDNGYHLGEKEVWAKHTLWERTTNVPMIWAGPGIAQNKEYSGVSSLLDIYPTLVEQCELTGGQSMDGQSLVGELTTPETINERAVLTSKKPQSFGYNFSVFTNEWHLLSYGEGEAEELYDAVNDKHEWYNLAADADKATILAELRAHLPQSPAAPALTKKTGLKLVIEGESFHWEKKVIEGETWLHEAIKNAPAAQATTISFEADEVLSFGVPALVDGKEIIIDGGDNNIVLDGGELSQLFKVSANAKLTLKNITLQNAKPSVAGAAIYADGELSMYHCTIADNKAKDNKGGAIGLTATVGYFENCRFLRNRATNMGGAVFTKHSDLTFVNCLFDGNVVVEKKQGLGSAVYSQHSIDDAESITSTKLVNCTFVNNQVKAGVAPQALTGGTVGTGIWNPTKHSAKQVVMKVHNCIFWNNESLSDRASAIAIMNGAAVELYHSLFEGAKITALDNVTNDDATSPFFQVLKGGGSITVANNNVDGSSTSVFGDGSTITTSPFIDVNNGGYELSTLVNNKANPAIDGGSTSQITELLNEHDLVGKARVHNTIDLGAFEYHPDSPTSIEKSKVYDLFIFADNKIILNNTLSVKLLTGEVYTIEGKRALLFDNTSQVIDVSHLTSGVYIIKAHNGEVFQKQKITIR